MSRNKPNLGEPYQIYSEVTDAGKNIAGSKKKVRWLFGFTEREGEVEVTLIHSIVSGKKTIFEDGKEIVSSTNRLATDFGHTWRSETCQGRLFRIEFATSMTTDPTVYTFTVDGIKFVDMPKKGSVGGGHSYGGGSGNYGANTRGSVRGFGSSISTSHAGGTGSGGRQSSFATGAYASSNAHGNTYSNTDCGFSKTDAPKPHANRRFIYGDDESGDEGNSKPAAAAAPTPAAAPRGNFQSPFSTTNSATNAGFGFDPFAESPASALLAAKPTAATSLFNVFEDSPPAAKVNNKQGYFDPFGSSNDPFGAADPFASPAAATTQQQRREEPPKAAAAPAAHSAHNKTPVHAAPAPAPASAPKAVPNFFDDDFAPAPVAPPAAAANNDFGNAFPSSVHTTPARRSCAVEISQDFVGMSFTALAPVPQKSPAVALFAAAKPEPVPKAEPVPVSNDPWSANSNLVNLDLSGNAAPKRGSTTDKGAPMSSMMYGSPAVAGNAMGTNTRASFTAGSLDMMMNNANTRGSFVAGPGSAPMGGMGGAPLAMGAPASGMDCMGGMDAGNSMNTSTHASFAGALLSPPESETSCSEPATAPATVSVTTLIVDGYRTVRCQHTTPEACEGGLPRFLGIFTGSEAKLGPPPKFLLVQKFDRKGKIAGCSVRDFRLSHERSIDLTGAIPPPSQLTPHKWYLMPMEDFVQKNSVLHNHLFVQGNRTYEEEDAAGNIIGILQAFACYKLSAGTTLPPGFELLLDNDPPGHSTLHPSFNQTVATGKRLQNGDAFCQQIFDLPWQKHDCVRLLAGGTVAAVTCSDNDETSKKRCLLYTVVSFINAHSELLDFDDLDGYIELVHQAQMSDYNPCRPIWEVLPIILHSLEKELDNIDAITKCISFYQPLHSIIEEYRQFVLEYAPASPTNAHISGEGSTSSGTTFTTNSSGSAQSVAGMDIVGRNLSVALAAAEDADAGAETDTGTDAGSTASTSITGRSRVTFKAKDTVHGNDITDADSLVVNVDGSTVTSFT